MTKDTDWPVAELESFRNGKPGLTTAWSIASLQLGPDLWVGGRPPSLGEPGLWSQYSAPHPTPCF